MRILTFAVVFVCLALSVSASEYWAVAGDDVQDVVNAANFAASMKGTTGVSFTGKTQMEQMTSSVMPDLAVTFDGNNAEIYGPDNRIADAAEQYLRGQGFRVKRVTGFDVPHSGDDADKDRAEEPALPEPEPEVVHEPVVVDQRAAPVEPEVPEPAPKPEEAQSIFSRVWRWFVGIFS